MAYLYHRPWIRRERRGSGVGSGAPRQRRTCHANEYRHRVAETRVQLDANEHPTVNVVHGESWVELCLRYLVHPRRGTQARNAFYPEVLARFNEHPDRVTLPASRSRWPRSSRLAGRPSQFLGSPSILRWWWKTVCSYGQAEYDHPPR